jgi:hypothetical protein
MANAEAGIRINLFSRRGDVEQLLSMMRQGGESGWQSHAVHNQFLMKLGLHV